MQKLAEICVRRPVFATMLILSLTVVGRVLLPVARRRSVSEDRSCRRSPSRSSIPAPRRRKSKPKSRTRLKARSTRSAASTSCARLQSKASRRSSSLSCSKRIADVAAQEVRNKIDLIRQRSAGNGRDSRSFRNSTPMRRRSCASPFPRRARLREVTDVADKKIKQQIESINGVGQVQIIGGRQREIQVWVDPDKMRAFNVTVARSRQCGARAEHGSARRPR